MIESLTINNYKSFGFEPNTLEIRPITIVVGKNNSGKSSLLKLLSILATMSEGSSSGPILLKNNSVSLGGRYQDLFHNNDTSSMTIQLYYSDGRLLKFLYLMNEGELYTKFAKPQIEKDERPLDITSQDNPFRPYIENITSIKKGAENPYFFTVYYYTQYFLFCKVLPTAVFAQNAGVSPSASAARRRA